MKPERLEYLPIERIDDFVTNVDTADLASNFALSTRGFRHSKPQSIGERDWGTVHRYANYPTGITIVNGYTLFIPSENRSYEIIFGYDANNLTHAYVDNGSATGVWTELTEFVTATVSAISGVTAAIGSVKDYAGNAISSMAVDYLKEFVAFVPNQTNSAGLVTTSTVMSAGNVTITLVNKPDVALSWGASSSIVLYRATGILPSSVLGTDRGFINDLGKTPHLRFLDVTAQNKLNVFYGTSANPPVTYEPIQIRKGGVLSPGSFTIGGSATGWTLGTSPVSSTDITSVAAILDTGTKYAWVTVGAAIYSTQDGGSTWTANTITNTNTLYGIVFLDKDNGFACGLGGVVYKCTNGSSATPSWTSVTTGTIGTADLYCISATDSTHVWVAGNGGKAFSTANAGTSWTLLTTGITKRIYCLQMADASNGWFGTEITMAEIVGQALYKTTNGGTSWVASGPVMIVLSTITSLSFNSATFGFFVMSINGTGNSVYKTSDGGTWILSTIGSFNSVKVIDASNVKIGGDSGQISSTADGGTTWTIDSVPSTAQGVLSQGYYSTTSGIAVGTGGLVMKLSGASGTIGSGPYSEWHVEKWGMLPDHVKFGTQTVPLAVGSTTVKDIAEGIRFSVAISEETVTDNTQQFVRMYVTALYSNYLGTANYQESDPIAEIYIASSGVNKFPRATITAQLDLAVINKNFYGFRFYEATNDIVKTPNAQWLEDPTKAIQAYQLRPDTIGWAIDTTKQYAYSNSIDQFTYALYNLALSGGAPSLQSNIGHVPVYVRTTLKPRYAVKVARDQGSLIIVDADNETARLAAYNGAGVLMDDSFPNVSIDNTGGKLIQALQGRGELYGLAVMRENLYAFYTSELFAYDFISKIPKLLSIDCVSKRSISSVGILDAPSGLAWAGKSAIYFLSREGGGFKRINLNWLNMYDGTLLTNDGVTPFMNDFFRNQVIAGYEPTYQDIWFTMPIAKETPLIGTVTDATNASPIVITQTAHGYTTGDLVYVNGVLGNTAANGIFRITKVGANTYSLNGSAGNGAYASGGAQQAFLCEYLNFRYNIEYNKWSVRKLNIGSGGNFNPAYFSRRIDNTFTIGYAGGLLQYPYRDQNGKPFEDDVLITVDGSGNITGVTSQSRGIETLIRINLGAIYNLEKTTVIYDIVFDYSGDATGDGDRYTVNMYAQGNTTSFLTFLQRARFKPSPMKIDCTRGSIEKAQTELTIPLGSLTNFKKLEIRKIMIGIVRAVRLGTN